MYVTSKPETTPRLKGYTGKRRYVVRQPNYGIIVVYAPDEVGAIRASAEAWGANHLEYAFYAPADVRPVQ